MLKTGVRNGSKVLEELLFDGQALASLSCH